MATKKSIFIAFAKEDESKRNLFTGQRIHARSPFDFVDMSVKKPYDTDWKNKVRSRVLRSDGVIALISSNTPRASGELWEITCAVEERIRLVGIWAEDGYRTKPSAMRTAPCRVWSWDNVAAFIDSL